MSRWTPDRVAIGLGVAGSMAGNVAYAWPHDGSGSWVLVGVGVAMSLVLPAAVRLWRATPVPDGGWLRAERALVMTAICAGAALYSLVHTTLLLADVRPDGAGLPGLIAWVPPAVMELLVVQAARAAGGRRAPRPSAGSPAQPGRKRDRTRTDVAPPRPVPAAPAVPSASAPRADSPAPARPAVVPAPADTDSTSAQDADAYAHLDEPAPPDETPEDRRRRTERNRKRRARARAADAADTEHGEREEAS